MKFPTHRLILLFALLASAGVAQNAVRIISAGGPVLVWIGDATDTIPEAETLIQNIAGDTVEVHLALPGSASSSETLYLLDKGKPTSRREFDYAVKRQGSTLRLTFLGMYPADRERLQVPRDPDKKK